MFRLLNSIFYSPTDASTITPAVPAGGTLVKAPTKGVDLIDVADLEPETIDLKSDKKDDKSIKKVETKEEETKDDEEVDDDTDEETDELDDILEDIEEPTEEQLELATPSSRRAILKEFPELFKKFPSLEKAYYRDQKYTEYFPTPAEAAEAKGKVEVLDNFEKDIMQGNTEAIFASVKETDPKAFNKIVDNLLPTLNKIDRNAYEHIVTNNIKEVIYHMWNTAKGLKNEEERESLQNIARGLNKFMFTSETYEPPTKLTKDEAPVDSTKETELARKEKEFNERQFNSARSAVMDKINSSVKNTIAKKIDEKDSMPEYVKKNAIRDALETFETQIKADKSFQLVLSRLWEHAKKNDYNQASLDKVKAAYTSKAGALLASVIKKARNEALRGIGKRVKDDSIDDSTVDDSEEEKSPRRAKPRAQNAGRDNESKNGGRVIPRGMTTAEWLAEK